MKILRYILGIVIFSSVSFLSQGQDTTGITPDVFCNTANSGTLAVSDSTICQGESVFLFFNANNPNGDNLTFLLFR
jgi:hypothetical protein